MGTLNAGRGIFIVSLEPTFQISGSEGTFIRQNGVIIFFKNPDTGATQSYQVGRALNSLTEIGQFKGYQIDNKGTGTVTFGNRWVGFGTTPDISHLSGSPSPTPTPTAPQGTIALTVPANNATVTAGLVNIQGTYNVTSGSLTNGIRWRFNGGAYNTLVANPTGGTFNQNVTINTAATGLLEVSFADNTAVLASRTITVNAASPSPTPTTATTGSGTKGTIQITAPTGGSTVASGNVTLEANLVINSGQTVSALEWSFNGSPFTSWVFAPTAGVVSRAIAIDNSGTGLLRVRFADETAIVSETTITVTAPPATPTAVATQSINIATNGFTATELDTNWNRFVSTVGTEQIVNNRFLPNGDTNSQNTGRMSNKIPFQITSTAANFSLFAKVVLDGQDSVPANTTQANYLQGFGIGFHNDPTPQLTANVATSFGIRDLTKCLSLEFSPPTNQIQLWRNPQNPTTVFAATTTATATNGIIYGTVYVWVDLIATTHVLNIYVANTTTKPATPDLTVDLDGTAIGPLATYFSNQAFLAIGGSSNFTGSQSSAKKPFRFEQLTFTASNT